MAAQRVQVQCINKTVRTDPHERIQRIGGKNADGTSWSLPLDDAISGVEQGKWAFFTRVGLTEVDVLIETHNGRKYLKTRNDGVQPDNLLALQECR